MMIASGLTCKFFENPYVQHTLQSLQPHHHPVYRLKLVRLVRCIIDESGEEVMLPIWRIFFLRIDHTYANTVHCYFSAFSDHQGDISDLRAGIYCIPVRLLVVSKPQVFICCMFACNDCKPLPHQI